MPARLFLLASIAVAQIAAAGTMCAQAGEGEEVSVLIDARLGQHHRSQGIVPAQAARDQEFIRRLTLDLLGRIPTAAEARAFAANTSPDKRPQAVARLMGSPEHPLHLGNVLDGIVQQSQAGRGAFRDYLRGSLQQGKTWDVLFREIIVGPWNQQESKSADGFLKRRLSDADRLTNDTARAFFGVDISCAQCHDHPLVADWQQRHYYGLKAFFNRTYQDKKHKLIGEKDGGDVEYVDTAGAQHTADIMFLSGEVVAPPSKLDPRLKDRQKQLRKQKQYAPPLFSPREALVKTALEERRFFSRAIVNQLWAHYLGRGLVHPVDQMHSENRPTVPQLLDELANNLDSSGYQLDRLVRGIVGSRAYQRSSIWTSTEPRPEEGRFALAALRPLSPEQMAVSMLIATGPQKLTKSAVDGQRRKRFEELEAAAAQLTAALDKPRGGFQSSVTEALFVSNNPAINGLTQPKGKNLTVRLVALGNSTKQIEEAFWCILSRGPQPDEQSHLADWLDSQKDRPRALEGLIWALCASAEFRFNH